MKRLAVLLLNTTIIMPAFANSADNHKGITVFKTHNYPIAEDHFRRALSVPESVNETIAEQNNLEITLEVQGKKPVKVSAPMVFSGAPTIDTLPEYFTKEQQRYHVHDSKALRKMAQSHKFFEDFDNEREVERQIDDKMYALAAENAGKDVKVIPRGFASATTVGDGIYKTSTSNTTQNSRMGDPITSTEVKQLTKYDLK